MKRTLLLSCCLAAMLAPAHPRAQNGAGLGTPNASPADAASAPVKSTNGPPNEAGSGRLETVVVTAQKRSERAQRAAIAIAVISPATLSRSGVQEFANIQKVLPDVSVGTITGNLDIAIRGVGTNVLGATSDSPTAIHLDGVYLSRPTGLQGFFYDLARVEELPGPQGTLYGRNATGGVINLITNKPTDQFGGVVEAEGGNYGLYRFNGAINVPVNDDLDLRAAGRIYHHDGYLSNGLDDAGEKGGRLEAKVKITPDATLLLSTDYETTNEKGEGLALIAEDYKSPSFAFGPPGAPPVALPQTPNMVPISSDPWQVSPLIYPPGQGTGGDFLRSKNYGAMAELDYTIGSTAILTAQGGYRREIAESQAEGPGDNPMAEAGALRTPSDATTYSAELRLASVATTPFQWVGGVFYFTEKTAGDTCIVFVLPSNSCGISYANPFQRTISYAAFGQGTYTPPILDNRLHLTAGGRYNQDKKNADTNESLFGTTTYNNGLKATFSAETYKLEASYDITPQNLIYVQNSTGFRAGGFIYGITPEYLPETIMAYEVGSKNRFFDDTLQVNLSAWHYIYKNQATQVSYLSPYSPIPIQTVASIGKAHYTGAQASVEYALTPDDRVELTVVYTDAHYLRFQIPPQDQTSLPLNQFGQPIPTDIPGDASGLQVAGTTPWTGNFAYDHTVHALRGAFDGRAAVQFSGVVDFSGSQTNTLQYTSSQSPAYARLDLSLSYTPDQGPWKVLGYVNNVTNNAAYTGTAYEGTSVGTGDVTSHILPPRTFGVIVTSKF